MSALVRTLYIGHGNGCKGIECCEVGENRGEARIREEEDERPHETVPGRLMVEKSMGNADDGLLESEVHTAFNMESVGAKYGRSRRSGMHAESAERMSV